MARFAESVGRPPAFCKLWSSRGWLVDLVKRCSPGHKVANVPSADLVIALEETRKGMPPEFTFASIVEGSGRHGAEQDELTFVCCLPIHTDQPVALPFAGLLLRDSRLEYTHTHEQLCVLRWASVPLDPSMRLATRS